MARPGRPRRHDPRADTLRQAIRHDPIATAQGLIAEAGTEVLDGEHRTLLYHAVSFGRLDLVDWLLAQGAQVNHQDRSGETALHVAARNGRAGLVEMLLRGGADPNLVDTDGNGPLWHATYSATLAVATAGNFTVLKQLLDAGADPARTNAHGVSPLEFAAVRKETQEIYLPYAKP